MAANGSEGIGCMLGSRPGWFGMRLAGPESAQLLLSDATTPGCSNRGFCRCRQPATVAPRFDDTVRADIETYLRPILSIGRAPSALGALYRLGQSINGGGPALAKVRALVPRIRLHWVCGHRFARASPRRWPSSSLLQRIATMRATLEATLQVRCWQMRFPETAGDQFGLLFVGSEHLSHPLLQSMPLDLRFQGADIRI